MDSVSATIAVRQAKGRATIAMLRLDLADEYSLILNKLDKHHLSSSKVKDPILDLP